MPPEAERALREAWKLFTPQICELLNFAEAGGRAEVKTKIAEWIKLAAEKYREESRAFISKKGLRNVRRLLFRAEALEEILKDIENV